MAQSLSHVVIHIIFSTKHRELVIRAELQPELFSYLAGTLRAIECPPIQVGGAEDHVHACLQLSRTMTIADVVQELKTVSSKWMKTKGVPDFSWQAGYGAFSVSGSKIDEVVAYIANQEQHHRHLSFQEEYRQFLERHGIEFDERYVWD